MEVGQLIIETTSEAQHTHIARRNLKVKMATSVEVILIYVTISAKTGHVCTC